MTKQYDCTTCGLDKYCINPRIPPEGNLNSRLLFVAEAPGRNEDILKRPLIGESGQILRTALVKAGIEEPYQLSTRTAYEETPHVKNVVLANTVICRPPDNATPNSQHIKACFHHVLELIERMPKLDIIVPVGNVALRAFTGAQGVTKLSGTVQEWSSPSGKTYKLVPLLHPASFLQSRNRTNITMFYEHVKRIANILNNSEYISDEGDYKLVTTLNEWEVAKSEIRKSGQIAYDIETNGLSPFVDGAHIKLIAISPAPYRAFAIPLLGWEEEDFKSLIMDLVSIFTDFSIKKIGHNVKFDNLWLLEHLGIEVENIVGDTKLSHYTLHPSDSNHLKDMAYIYTNMGGYQHKLPDEVQNLSINDIWRYACVDADICHRIYIAHQEEFKVEPELEMAYRSLLLPTSIVLTRMEHNGIKLNPVLLFQVIFKELQQVINDSLGEILSHPTIQKYMADKNTQFNPNSHKQLADVLFLPEYEGLTPVKFTAKSAGKDNKTPSTDKSVLIYYKDTNELVSKLAVYNQHKSLEKTINELRSGISFDNRIHTTFWLTETRSGRSSSSDPNLQNIPKDERDILGVRKAFVADPGYLLVECDFNQHELRCMADEADDDVLRKAVLTGDVHRATAANVLGIDPSQVTDDQRRNIGKVFNFGIIYGMTIYGIIKRMGLIEKYTSIYKTLPKGTIKTLAEAEAQKMLDKFFSVYKKTKDWMDKTMEFVKEHRYVIIRPGFKKYFPKDLELTDHEIRSAINLPIQGLAGNILFYALIGVDNFLRFNKLKSKLLLEIHDSVLLEVHKSELDIIHDIKRIMCTYFKRYIVDFTTPIEVDVKIGENWGEMEKFKG